MGGQTGVMGSVGRPETQTWGGGTGVSEEGPRAAVRKRELWASEVGRTARKRGPEEQPRNLAQMSGQSSRALPMLPGCQ